MTLFFLSAATLLFEINLSRLLSVAQFYHFAFMVVSLALLGYGASGTALAIFPGLLKKSTRLSLAWFSLACSLSIFGAYLLMNHLHFDSFSIAWDRRQVFILASHYLFLSLPFFFNGLAIGILLAQMPQIAGRTYALNLLGSAFGCLAALLAPLWLGGEGVVVLSSSLACVAVFSALLEHDQKLSQTQRVNARRFSGLSMMLVTACALVTLVFALSDLGLRLSGQAGFPFFTLQISPYKSLAIIQGQAGARMISSRWNAYARVDVVDSPGIHSFPGLSYRYLEPLTAQQGLLVDGDDLSPLLPAQADLKFSAYLPAAIAFRLHASPQVLVLGGRAGLDIWTSLALGAAQVDAVEVNPLIVAASPVYAHPDVQVILSDERSYLNQTGKKYDLIIISLNSAFHPIRSGAYSLVEDYRYTVEAFRAALSHLQPGGTLVVTRWLQQPPSEDLRTFALAVSALEELSLDPRSRIVALRGYNTATFLVQNQPFQPTDLEAIRNLASERAFDLSYAPGLDIEDSNRYNILEEALYYQAYHAFLDTQPRENFYHTYPFDVRPPSDDHPFFGHFFKWSQASQVLSELGRTWQPFGGAGYFVILALLGLALFLSAVLILLPALLTRVKKRQQTGGVAVSARLPLSYGLYFGLIGLAFLLVEIPLIQKFILYLGQPAYAMASVLFTLLFFSGLGSWQVKRISWPLALTILVLFLAGMPILTPIIFEATLGYPFIGRLALTILILAPVGFLMGIPFPAGIRQLEQAGLAPHIPWSWAINGAASVVSAVLAALLALTFGFSNVLYLGALCYLGALFISGYLWRIKGSLSQPAPPLAR